MALKQHAELTIDEDVAFEIHEWRVLRVMLWVMPLILVAAVAGAFGNGGPLSRREAQVGTLRVSYDLVVRREAVTEIAIDADASGDLAVSRSLLEGFRLERVVPQPREMAATGDRVVLRFADAGRDEDFDEAFHATLVLLPLAPGKSGGWISAADGSRVSLRQFILP